MSDNFAGSLLPNKYKFTADKAETWPKWKNKFKIFMIATGKLKTKDEEMKIAVLLSLLGDEGIEVHDNSDAPKASLEQVLTIFDNYCVPTVNVTIETFKFNSINRKSDQSFESFVTELRTQAQNCAFVCSECNKSYSDRMIRDKILVSETNTETQQSLLREEKLTLEKCEKICRASELSQQYSNQLRKDKLESESKDVFKINKKGDKRIDNFLENDRKRSTKYKCKKCGMMHLPRQCPAYGRICNTCGLKNHFTVGCFSRLKSGKKVNEIQEKLSRTSSESSLKFDCDSIEAVECSNLQTKTDDRLTWTETIIINDTHAVTFKLDTASDINIINKKLLCKIDPEKTVKKNKIQIKAYGGFIIEPLGYVDLKCAYKDKTNTLRFVIVATLL